MTQTIDHVYLINARNEEKWFPITQDLMALQFVKDELDQTRDIVFGIAKISYDKTNPNDYEVLSENGFEEILLNVLDSNVLVNRTILTINTNTIEVAILNNRKISAIATEDPEFPRIDVYLDTPDDHYLIASIEDNRDTGLRIHAYNDLSSDEPTTNLGVHFHDA